MKKTIFLLGLATTSLIACNNNANEKTAADTTQATVTTTDTTTPPAKDGWADLSTPEKEKAIRDILPNTAGYTGWTTEGEEDILSFTADGKVQFAEEGKSKTGNWQLAGDQLTIAKEKGEPKKYTAKVDGDKLVLGDKTYNRAAAK
jgi:uncharacterized lipoprotein NlpE involved in copper resistance